MRSKQNPSYVAMYDILKRASRYIETEINNVHPHTQAWYRLYELHTHLELCISDMKLIHNEVLGNGDAYRYDGDKDMRVRIAKQLGYK